MARLSQAHNGEPIVSRLDLAVTGERVDREPIGPGPGRDIENFVRPLKAMGSARGICEEMQVHIGVLSVKEAGSQGRGLGERYSIDDLGTALVRRSAII